MEQLDFTKDAFQSNSYCSSFLNPATSTNWISSHELGLLKIYLDDMTYAVLSVPLNMGMVAEPD